MTKPLPYLVVFDYLVLHPEQTATQIATSLKMDKTTVNGILYKSPRVFVSTGEKRPKWSSRSISRRVVTRLISEK
jgi:hypothetical protein